MNLVEEFDTHTSHSSRRRSATVYLYDCGNVGVAIVREKKDIPASRSVTNSVEFIVEAINNYIKLNDDIPNDIILITGYETGHPYEYMGYSAVTFMFGNDVNFKYLGNTMEDVEKYVIMDKLKHG